MKVLLVTLLGCGPWLTAIMLAAKYHVRHYRYLLRIARRGSYSKESLASLHLPDPTWGRSDRIAAQWGHRRWDVDRFGDDLRRTPKRRT